MNNYRIILVALAIIVFPALCLAEPPNPGAYVTGFLGITVPANTDASGTFNDRIEFDPGIYLGATGGYDFGFLRLEGELSYKQAEIKSITDIASGNRFRGIDGNLGALAMMFNGFLDLHNDSPVTPYLGGGIGFASMHLSDTFGTDTGSGTRTFLYDESDDAVFAYQGGAGLEIALNRLCSLDLGYRYFRTSRADFDSDQANFTSMKFESHNAAIGFRYKF